jgi:AhpD family alkylhydroperoxidase
MTKRLEPFAAAPAGMKLWLDATQKIVADSSIEFAIKELVKIRASQLNGCANCLNMHVADARKAGETNQRLDLIAAWHEAPCYTPRERAALAWTEAMTLLATERAPDHIYAMLDAQFTPQEQVELTLMINAVNGWNRIAVGFGLFYETVPGRAAA